MTVRARIFFLVVLLAPAPAFSATVADGVKALGTCVKARDAKACRNHLTADSLPLYDRFVGYNLMGCLPEETAYMSHKTVKPFALARTRVAVSKKEYAVQLALVQEQGQWKLDLPETLRRGIGPQWQDRLSAVEQLYLLLKSQLGDKLNCEAIRGLGGGLTATAQ